MPFENVHGNGGLLTTVGDLLTWNANFATPRIRDAAFVAQQERPGTFNDGRAHGYAMGLQIQSYKGLREIAHGGSTAGYAAYLARFPDQQLSVAVLCNIEAGEAGAAAAAHRIADAYLGDRLRPVAVPRPTHALTSSEIAARQGLYVGDSAPAALRLVPARESLRVDRGPVLVATSASTFVTSSGDRWEIDGRGRATVTDQYGTVERYTRAAPATPTPEQLKALEGTYVSAEAEATLTVVSEGAKLVVKRRPDTVIALTPLYKDVFEAESLGTVTFRRDAAGRVSALSVSQGRVWDLRFARQPWLAAWTRRQCGCWWVGDTGSIDIESS
jgi:hypothetical protein